MPHGYDTYRVFVSSPGDLWRDGETCHAAISDTNAEDAMPHKLLLVTVGVREDRPLATHRGAVNENVRWCTYFIQIFQDNWGPQHLFRKMFYFALECRDDPQQPMRDVIVCLKAAEHATDPEILAFRKELSDRTDVRLFEYKDAESLKTHLREVCAGWVETLLPEPMTAGS